MSVSFVTEGGILTTRVCNWKEPGVLLATRHFLISGGQRIWPKLCSLVPLNSFSHGLHAVSVEPRPSHRKGHRALRQDPDPTLPRSSDTKRQETGLETPLPHGRGYRRDTQRLAGC